MHSRFARFAAVLLCGFMIAAIPLCANAAQRFADLTAKQRELLSAYEKDWDGLDPDKQERLVRNADKWAVMSPQKQTRVKARLKKWQAMTEQERALIREQYALFKKLDPSKKAKLRRARQRLNALPPQEQRALIDKWKKMPKQKRQKAIERYGKPVPSE